MTEQRPGPPLRLDDGTPLVLAPDLPACAFEAARSARDLIADRGGPALAIERHGRSDGLGLAILLRLDPALADRVGAPPAVADQAYCIDVGAQGVVVRAGGMAGLRFALVTFRQVLDGSGRLPAMRIRDWPDFATRGVMLDVSRGKVPEPRDLRSLVDRLADLKLNALMLYTEHTFRFRRHPLIGKHDSPLDAEDMQALDVYARSRGIELIPCLQSLGHMAHVLKLDEYAHLAESERGWTIAPTEPGTLELLRDLYDEYLPNFSSTRFNANCDEPWDLGHGQSRGRSEALGGGGVYLEHIRAIQDLAKAHGKRTMIWGDVVHGHPERIAEIPTDLIMLDWWYEADFDYDRVGAFAEAGLDFMVCPGTSSWNSLFPRVDNSLRNISSWAEAGRRHGALGLITTDWGDHGHYNLLGNSLLAYAWGAQESWSGPRDTRRFDGAFSRVLFGEPRGRVARLYRDLGAIHDPGFMVFNGSPYPYLFFDELERGLFLRGCRPSKLRAAEKKLRGIVERASRLVSEVRRDALTLSEVLYAAEATLFAVRKAQAALEERAWRAKPKGLRAAGRRALAARLRALADEQRALAQRFRRLWLARARPSNIEMTERRLRASIASLRRAARSLEANRPRPVDRAPFDPRLALRALRDSLAEAGSGASD